MELPKDGRVVPEHVELLLGNRQALVEKFGLPYALYTPPSRQHYPHLWDWDETFSDIVFAREGFIREATTGFFSLMAGVKPNGMLPNMVFAPKGRKFDLERYSFMHPLESSDYTQPPLEALAATEIYEALKKKDHGQANLFLKSAFEPLDRRYRYLERNYQNSPEDSKLGVDHPHSPGRDSDPTFNFFKHRLPRKGKETSDLVNLINTGTDYASVIALSYRQRLAGWEPEKTRKNFWVNDVMFNCIYVDNLYEMARLAESLDLNEDAVHYKTLAGKTEQRILKDMWFKNARNGKGSFYALNNGVPILETSVSNLFPLILPSLEPEQLGAILDQLENSFNTDFPIPSVATDSPNYDPSYSEKHRLWQGTTWINMNWYLVERGLQMQAACPKLQRDYPNLVQRCIEFGNKVVRSSHSLVDQGYWEFYDAETGEPYRIEHFAWSALARLLREARLDWEGNLALAA